MIMFVTVTGVFAWIPGAFVVPAVPGSLLS